MAHFFRAPDRRQRFLLPVDMMDWLPEDDIVHLIVDAVGLMDLSGFEATCKVGHAGQPPFAPAMMLALLIYAYSHGVRSSRVIERLCRRDAGYRFIVGDEAPDHTVIAAVSPAACGTDEERVPAGAGAVPRGGVDPAGASGAGRNEGKGQCGAPTAPPAASKSRLAGCWRKPRRPTRGRTASSGPRRRPGAARGPEASRDRLARLKACREKLANRAAAAAARQQEKIAARDMEEKATGRRKRGRKPKEPDAIIC